VDQEIRLHKFIGWWNMYLDYINLLIGGTCCYVT